ncbi:hypothetical protein GQ53DRAFT_618888, partial [Thozetella sp. PMI_491]
MPPPDGSAPLFDETSSLQRTLVIVYSITFSLATFFLVLRMYTCAYLVHRIGIDELTDHQMLETWNTDVYLPMRSGFGKHIWDVSVEQFEYYPRILLGIAASYMWTPTLVKLALLALYHRINPTPLFRICVYAVGFSLIIYTVICVALLCGPCSLLDTTDDTCLNNIALTQAILNILSDVILIVMPVPMIFGLGLPMRQKLNILAILSLGSGATVASIVRITYIKSMAENPDATWTQAAAAVWSFLEINLGITCNCLALMKPFVRHHLPWL